MPVTPKLEEMRQRAAEAKAAPSKYNDFVRLRLDRPKSRVSKFFDVTAWLDPANSAEASPPELALAWGGLDLGWSRDLSALALWIPRDDRFDLTLRAWAPEAAAERRGDGLYEAFAEEGWLTLTEGDVRDDDVLEADIAAACAELTVRRLMYDRAMASGLVVKLLRSGLPVEPVVQGWITMSPAMKELERLALAGLLNHGGNRLLAWAIGNANTKSDDNGNIRPVKPSAASNDKIDPLSATLDAVAGWLGDRDELPTDDVPGFEWA